MSEFQEFPKMLYRKGDGNAQKIVNNAAEEEALGDEWVDAPTDPLAPATGHTDPAPTTKKK